MSKLVILRHGEKPKGKDSALALSPVGKARALFLSRTYLGKGAAKLLFGARGPDVFFTVTPHTIATATPSAESWGLPVTAFATAAKSTSKDAALDKRTQDAAAWIRRSLGKGKDVVVVWEHHRIADARLGPQTTLRGLLKLAKLGVPETWPDSDYDTIWVFGCGKGGTPESFAALAQQFVPPSRASAGKGAPGKAVKETSGKKKSGKKGARTKSHGKTATPAAKSGGRAAKSAAMQAENAGNPAEGNAAMPAVQGAVTAPPT